MINRRFITSVLCNADDVELELQKLGMCGTLPPVHNTFHGVEVRLLVTAYRFHTYDSEKYCINLFWYTLEIL
jgi:hypothetical protein